jgi:E3 ubiquitin-protein ligase UBR7
VDEEIYEPAEDTDEGETLEQVTERVVGSLPRVQAIEAVHGYQTMK